MHLDYPGRDSAEVPVELRNPPENEGFWRLFNGDKDKIIRFGQDYGTKRKVFYLIDVKLDRGTEKETEYSFESGGKDVLSYFRLGKNQVYVLVSDNGNDFGVGTLEDLVQRQ